MAITTDCPTCGRRYKAPDHMLGQRVRCRGCGTVFPLATGGDGGAADLSALAELAGASDPAAALAAAAGDARPADEASAAFEGAFADFTPTVRPNRPFYFPLAHHLDRFLPVALFAGSALWVTIEAFNRNRSGAIWVPFVRLLLLTAGYFLIVWPLGNLAMSKAAKLAKFELPPTPRRRTAASLALPYGIVCLLWLTVGSFSDAVPGVILGLAVLMGCVWLLIRVRAEEAAVALGLSSAGFLASLLILVGVLSGVNAVAQLAAGESKSTSLAESPIGPGMAWAVRPPVPKTDPASKKRTGAVAEATPTDPTAGTSPGTASAGPTLPGGAAPIPPAVPSAASAAAGTPAVPGQVAPSAITSPGSKGSRIGVGVSNPAATDPLASSKMFGTRPSAPPPSEAAPPAVADVPPDPDPVVKPIGAVPIPPPGTADPVAAAIAAGEDPVAAEVRAARSPLVASVRPATAIGPFERLVPTLTPSPVALVVKRAAGGGVDADQLEVWNLDRTTRVGSVDVKRDAGKGVGLVDGTPAYAVSPDGGAWARVTSFPSLGLESTPFAGNAAPVRVPFKEPYGDAAVLGYVAADRVLVRWRNADNVRLEVWDLKFKAAVTRTNVPYHHAAPGNGVVSPDGKMYAALVGVPVRTGGYRIQLSLFDLVRPGGRNISLTGMEPELAVKPTGMAFSADLKSIGLLYEQNGNTVLMAYRLATLAAMTPVPVAAGKVPVVATPDRACGRLTSVADGRGWLVGGNAVLDADTGGLLGTLGVTRPCSHVAVGGNVELIHGEGDQRSVAVVTFNKNAIGKPAGAAPGVLPAPASVRTPGGAATAAPAGAAAGPSRVVTTVPTGAAVPGR